MAGKKTGKRLLTWVLVLVMALSLLPLNALAARNSTVVLHPSVNHTVTGVKVKVGDTISGYNVKSISGYDITVDLGKYNVNNDTFRLPYAKDIWTGVDNNKVDYISWAGNGSNKRSEGASALLANGKNTAYYYFKGAPVLLTFTLNYDANGGTGAPASQTYKATSQYEKSHTFTIASQAPTRENYTFLGWSTNRNAASASYQPSDSIVVTGTTTLYAVWKENTPPKPDKPTAPGEDDLSSLIGNITVNCTNTKASHASKGYALISGSYTTGEVEGNAENGYTYTVTINSEKYVEAFNADTGATHTPKDATATVTLEYKNNAWAVKNGTPVVFNVACKTEIVPPVGPSEEELSKLEKPVEVICTTKPETHTAASFALRAGTYTIGDVTGNETDGYTCDITVTADEYVKKYSTDYGKHTLSGDPTKTLTLNYVAGKWAADGTVTFNVKCEEELFPVHLVIYRNGNTSEAYKNIALEGQPKGHVIDLSTIDIADYYTGNYEFYGWYDDGLFNIYKSDPANPPAGLKEKTVNGWTNFKCMVYDYVPVVYFQSVEAWRDFQNDHSKTEGRLYSTTALFGSALPTTDAPTPTRTGYTFKFWSREGQSSDVTGQTVNGWTNLVANWEKDESQTQNTSYTVQHKVDGKIIEEDTKTYTSTAWINETDPTIAIVPGSLSPKSYDGYKYVGMEPEIITDTVASGTIITLTYEKRTDLTCSVQYYWKGDTETPIAQEKTVENLTLDASHTETARNIDGYTPVENSKTITISADKNEIIFYYYKDVTLTANSQTVPYDGKPHNGAPYSYDALGLLPGHTVEPVDYTCEPQTNVGEYDIALDNAKIVDDAGNDVTDFYQISYNYGKLTIKPLDVTVTIKGNTGNYDYDGTEKTVEGYTLVISDDLYKADDVKLVDSQAKIRATVPGTYQMGLKPGNFENTNPNFNVTFVVKPNGDGKLTINNRPITITADDVTVTYDGQPHGANGYRITMGSLVDGHTATVTINGSKTDAGEPKELLVPSVTKIVNAKGKDVTSYYDISYEDGKLTINKRSVTLTSASDSKVYDGTPLTNDNVTVGGEGFATGEGATYDVTGTITNVGTKENAFTYTLNDNTNADNYTITKTEGKLEITEAPTYNFNLNDLGIKVYKNFVSKYGRSVKMSFTATATIEKQETYIIVNPGIGNNVTNNGSTVTVEPTYTKVGEVTGTVTLETDKKPKAFDFDKDSKFPLQPGTTYRITVKETNCNDRYVDYDTNNTNDTKTHTRYFKVSENGAISQIDPITITNVYTKRHTAATPSKPTLNTGDHYAYVMGYPDGTVRPNGSITRAEVSAILFRLLSDKTRDEYFTTESSFTDVKAGAWYNNSIATLEKAGVIVDTAKGGAFRPNEAITRAELAAMLAQFADAKPVKGVKFSDVSAEHWAYEAIAIAAKMGWIEGYPDGTFRPDATITRAEMMTLVNRALERVPSDEDHLLSKRVMLTFPDCKSGDWFYIAVQEATNSHTYERAATEKNGDEQWTALRANRDWTQLEK